MTRRNKTWVDFFGRTYNAAEYDDDDAIVERLAAKYFGEANDETRSIMSRYNDDSVWVSSTGKVAIALMDKNHMFNCLPYIDKDITFCENMIKEIDYALANKTLRLHERSEYVERLGSYRAARNQISDYKRNFIDVMNNTKKENTMTTDYTKTLNIIDAKNGIKCVKVKFSDDNDKSNSLYTYKIEDDLFDKVKIGDAVVVQSDSSSRYTAAFVVSKHESLYSEGVDKLVSFAYKWVISTIDAERNKRLNERATRIVEAVALSEVEKQIDDVLNGLSAESKKLLNGYVEHGTIDGQDEDITDIELDVEFSDDEETEGETII